MICGTERDTGTFWDRLVTVFGADSGEVGASDWVQLQQALARVAELTEQLEKQVSTLPHLDTHGHVYPDMEEQYAIKEEHERELSVAIQKLEGLLPQLQRQMDRRRQNLERVRADAAKLSQAEVRKGYSQAEEAARKQYMQALHYRDHTIVTLTKARSVLDVARKKKFPGREPRRQTPSRSPGPNAPRAGEVVGDTVERELDENEMDGLIALGPLPDSGNAVT